MENNDQYGLDEKGNSDATMRSTHVWTPCTLPELTEFDEVWADSANLDNFELAKRLASWCMHKASTLMLEQGHHPVTFILAKSKEKMAALDEHELREEIVRGLSDSEDPEDSGEEKVRRMHPKDFKDALSRHLRAVVKAMQPIAVAHVAEAKMAAIRIDGSPEERELVRKMNAGHISMLDVPDKFTQEILMVRVEIQSGKVIMLKRRILRNKHDTFSGLGAVEMQIEDMKNDKLPPGVNDDGRRGRFSDFWNADGIDDLEAFSIEVDKTISKDTWKL